MKKVLICLMALMTSIYSWGAVSYRWENSYTKLIVYKGDSDNGVTKDYASNVTSGGWFDHKSTVTTIVIEDGVITIGEYAFRGFDAVTSITIPTSLTTFKTGAFDNCEHITTIKYAGSPNQWANIDFANQTANPIGKSTGSTPTEVKNNRGFCFYGSNTKTRQLVITQGLDSIKQFAFINARYFTSAYIPSSVQKIKQSALICDFDTVVVNRTDRPRLANSTTISFNNPSKLIVPTGASTNYSPVTRWWAYSSSNNNKGAGTIVEKNVSGTVDGQSWSLGTNGVLTISGSGALTTSFVTDAGANQYPYYYFRYLVDKVVVTGGITGLSNILQQCAAVREVDIDQAKIPTASSSLPTLIHGGTIALVVNPTALADASVSNLSSTPWTNDKFGNVTLSSNLVINDNADYSTILANCSTYVEAPITLQLGRTLTDEQYNTFCSPIPMTADDISSIFGGADIRALESSNLVGDELMLEFSASSLDAIEAGKPYLVRPTTEVANPTFENIAPSSLVSIATNTETDFVDFIGVLAPTPLTGGNKNTLFLGAGNELFWPEANGNIGGMRAYFSVKGAAQKNGIRARIVMNKEVATGIQNTEHRIQTQKVLRNGQIIIIRDGKEYNVMGIMMK